jgi:Amt family ammonium transporter
MSFDVSELDTTERAMYDAINTIVEGTKEDVARMYSNLDVLLLLFGAYLVFFMQVRLAKFCHAYRGNYLQCVVWHSQCGFALLEAGSVRAKNTKNILLKNVLDACLGGLIWWTIGFPIALGDIGGQTEANHGKPFFLDRLQGRSSSTYYAMWLFQWAFAATAATIVSVT